MESTSSAAIYNRRGQRSNTSHISGRHRKKRAAAQTECSTDSETKYTTLADCQCKIELDGNYSEILTNFDTIKGIVHFYLKRHSLTDAPQEFKSLRIQLEGIATSKLNRENQLNDAKNEEDQNGLLLTNQNPLQVQNEDRFLPSEEARDSFFSSLCFSSLCFHFVKANHPTEPRILSGQCHSLPFEILLTGQTLPASFKTNFGKIDYRLVVYGCLVGDFECVAGEKILSTKGCLNLSQDRDLYVTQRVSVNSGQQKQSLTSLFFSKSKRPALNVNFVVNKGGFLPQEWLTWQMHLDKPICDQIQRVRVTFLQKIVYFLTNQKPGKVTTTVLSEQEFEERVKIWQVGRIRMGDGLMPTFSRKNNKALEICYVIQFTVDLMGQPGMSGEIPIVIGTVRDEEVEHGAEFCDGQVMSMAFEWDTVSIQACSDPPPSYSNLTSRCPSVETLPPAYEEVDEESDRNQIQPSFWQLNHRILW